MTSPAAARGALTLLPDGPPPGDAARPSRWQVDQLAIDLGAA